MDEAELKEKLAQYKFYHIIKLADGVFTPGSPKHVPIQKLVLKALARQDLVGKRVLDIGCRDGLFSFEAERMGSSEVMGIDNDLSRPAVEFLIPYFQSRVKMVEMNLFEMRPDTFGQFDVVIFAGVLYHLRYPFLALRIIRQVMKEGGLLLLETAVWRGGGRHAMLYCPIGEDSPYEPTSCTFFNEKGLVDSLGSFGFKTESVECLYGRPSLATLVGRSRRIAHAVLKRMQGAREKSNIDRAMLVCRAVSEPQDDQVRAYWDSVHDIHTRLG
jgi:SAM-dependent methyltransferase